MYQFSTPEVLTFGFKYTIRQFTLIRCLVLSLLLFIAAIGPALSGGSIMPLAQAQISGAQIHSDVQSIRFATGRLDQDMNSPGNWTEFDSRGQSRFNFREIGSDADTLTLSGTGTNVVLLVNFNTMRISGEWANRPMSEIYIITDVLRNTPPVVDPPIVEPPITDPPVTDPPVMPPLPPSSEPIGTALFAAYYAQGRFEKLSPDPAQEYWFQYTESGANNLYRKIGHDGGSLYLYDLTQRDLIEIDTARRMVRQSSGDALRDLYPITRLELSGDR